MTGEIGQSSGQTESGSAQQGGVKTVKVGGIEVPQDAFDSMIKERINEVKDRERGKYKDYDQFRKDSEELKKIRETQLTKEQNLENRIKELEGQVAEKDQILSETALRATKRSKIEKLIESKEIKLPDGVAVSDLVDMVPGSDEETMAPGLDRLKKLFPVPRGLGTSTQGGQQQTTQDKSLLEQAAEALNRGDIDESIRLKNEYYKNLG